MRTLGKKKKERENDQFIEYELSVMVCEYHTEIKQKLRMPE